VLKPESIIVCAVFRGFCYIIATPLGKFPAQPEAVVWNHGAVAIVKFCHWSFLLERDATQSCATTFRRPRQVPILVVKFSARG